MYNGLNPKNISEIKAMLSQKHTQAFISQKLNISKHNVFKVNKDLNYNTDTHKIRVCGVSIKMKNDLYNISDNLGQKFSEFMKKEFKKIIDSYPEKMKQPIKDY